MAIDYPADLLHIIIITDGSTDGTNLVVGEYPAITSMHQPERKGKLAAIKRAMQTVQTPIVVFSDANTFLNRESVRRMVTHYQDKKIGGIAGEKKILGNRRVSAVGEAEGFYWQYESFMKRQDASFNTVVGAAGELFSIRTALFRSPDDSVILDDFIISMQVCLQGYKIEYEPGAFAVEPASASLQEEEKRKTRISAGAYQSVWYLRDCLNLFKYPLLSFQFVSRQLLRWIFSPPSLALLFLSNAWLVAGANTPPLFNLFFYAQLIFYVVALLGWIYVKNGKKAGLLSIPFYFCFMNYCLVIGCIRFLQRKQSVLWEKSLRQAMQ